MVSLQTDKQTLLRATRSAEWCLGVGIALVNGQPGLKLSVKRGHRTPAEKAVQELGLESPVSVRELEGISAR